MNMSPIGPRSFTDKDLRILKERSFGNEEGETASTLQDDNQNFIHVNKKKERKQKQLMHLLGL